MSGSLTDAVDGLSATIANQGRQIASMGDVLRAQTEMLYSQGKMLDLLLGRANEAQEPGPLLKMVEALLEKSAVQVDLLGRVAVALERLNGTLTREGTNG